MVHHGEFLRAATRDDHLVYHLQRDPARAALDEQERAMLTYAGKLVSQPAGMTAADVHMLRQADFDDRNILDIVLVVGLYSLMNRVSNALGVEPEANMLTSRERGERRVRETMTAE